ncbi:MAG: hypothetical protein ACXW2P_10155 [Thermoanaerobaculia bacterium]
MSTTRRKFARIITTAAAVLPVITANLFGQTAAPASPPTTAKAAEEEQPEAKRPTPLAIALAGVVSAQSGQYLNEAEMQKVFDDFKDYIPYVESFRDYKLTNADEPDFTFHSLVRRWRSHAD